MIRRLLLDELARGSSLNLVFILSNLVVQLAVSLLLAAYLGPQGVGAFAVGMLVLESAMVLVHLPGVAFVREFAAGEQERALATVTAIKLILCIPTTAAMLLIAYPVSAFFSVPVLMIQLLALVPPTTVVSSVAVMIFEARRKMLLRNLPVLAETGGRLLAILLVLYGAFAAGAAPETAALIWIAGTIPSALLGLALARFPNIRLWEPSKARAYFAFGWKTSLAGFIQKQLMWIGTISIYIAFLAVSVDAAQRESGLFKIAFSLMYYLATFGNAVVVMVYPMMSRAHALTDEAARRAELHRLLSLAFFYELIIATPLAAILLLGSPWAFGLVLPGFLAAAPMAQALALVGLLLALTLPAATILPAVNRPDLVLRLFLLQAAIAVALNVILAPRFNEPWGGAWGAVIADWAAAAAGFAYAYRLVASTGVPFPTRAALREVLRAKPPETTAPRP